MLSRRHVVALVDVGRARVLVDSNRHLPAVDDDRPTHRDLVAVVGDPGALVVAPPLLEDDGTVVTVLAWSGGSFGDGLTWVGVDEVAATAGLGTLGARVGDLRAGVVPDDGREPWFAPGWIDEVDAWVGDQVAGCGWERVGPRELVKVWSLSALVRYPVRDGAGDRDLWFKATCRGFRAEPVLTAWVASLDRTIAPEVVAVDADRAWMLLEGFVEQDDDPTLTEVSELATAHARLQLSSVGHVDGLLAAGGPDRGLGATLSALHRVVHDGIERPTMTDQQRAAAVAVEPWLVEQVTALHGLGLPLSLVHGDLHLGNVT